MTEFRVSKKNIPEAIKQAMALHQQGILPQAETIYRQILALSPKDPNALLNLSTLYSQRAEFETALPLLKKLTASYPAIAYGHFALGNVYRYLQKPLEAAASYSKAIALEPNKPDYYYNRGVVLDAAGKYDEALASYDKAIALQPGHTDARTNHASNLYMLGRYEEALALANQLIADYPNLAVNYTTRGNALGALGRTEEALADYTKAIALQPDLAVAHNNIGALLEKKEDGAEALARYEQAIAINPQYADAHNNRATALNKVGRYQEALASANEAITLNPKSALAYDTRANAYKGLERYEEAIADYDHAIALDPALANARWNKSLLSMLIGDLAEGLRLYEWRWKTEFQKGYYREYSQPLWLGKEPLEGKTLLIHPEQGFGDYIQCSRYFPLLVAMGATLIIETPPVLLPLFFDSFPYPAITFIPKGQASPPFDYHCPIMSLPLAMGATLTNIPAEVPYLKTTAERRERWEGLLGPKTKPRVGLVWSGSAIHANDKNRSMPLSQLAPLFALPIEFHSLQKEIRDSDRESLPHLKQHEDEIRDFADTAALVEVMDLVLSVDTSVAHLAGALAKPLWVMLPYIPDYRWLLGRTDSVWYPTARLFRQPKAGDWDSVIATLKEALQTL